MLSYVEVTAAAKVLTLALCDDAQEPSAHGFLFVSLLHF